MTAVCLSLLGIILPFLLMIAYKVGRIESQVDTLNKKVDTYIKKGGS